MKMKMLLLVSVVFLLGSPSTAGPIHKGSPSTAGHSHESLDDLFEVATNYNKSLTWFMEDVSHLVENKCEDKFFCEVNNILHANLCVEDELVRTLQAFINDNIPNCKELQKNRISPDILKPLSTLLKNLIKCIQSRNFNALPDLRLNSLQA